MKSSSSSPEGGLSAEQSKKLLQDIEVIKAKQLEAQKVLEELDEE